jgi:hypothetical protein
MKTAGKENPNRCAITRQPTELLERKLELSLLNQAGWKARKHPATAKYFFLTFPFIELIGGYGYSAPIYCKYESVVCVFSAECYFNWGLVNCLYNAVDIGLRDDCGAILFLAKQ